MTHNKEKQAFNIKKPRDDPDVGMSRQDFKIVFFKYVQGLRGKYGHMLE